jgi:hypothetical protein
MAIGAWGIAFPRISQEGDDVAALQTDKSAIPYRDVARWRTDFFACLICRSASSLRTESNTANATPGGGVTLAVFAIVRQVALAGGRGRFCSFLIDFCSFLKASDC